MAELILMRHGESLWNRSNLFTGWVDVPLSQQGIEEAIQAGKALQHQSIDVIFTSTLIRAQETLAIAMAFHRGGKTPVFLHPEEGNLEKWATIHGEVATIPVYRAWQLNERRYGDLQGLNKDETRMKYGVEQVKIWRRSYDIAPPKGESLKMCAARTLPYFDQEVVNYLTKGQNVLISAHGNSLRSIIMKLDGLTAEQVVNLEIPLGKPIMYHYLAGEFSK